MAGNTKTYSPFRFFIYSCRLSTVHRCNERAPLRRCFGRLSSGRLFPVPNTSNFPESLGAVKSTENGASSLKSS